MRSNFDWKIWWCQLKCKDIWIPELTYKFGWCVKIILLEEELCSCIWVGAFIICWNPLQDINQRDFVQSVVLMFGGVNQN